MKLSMHLPYNPTIPLLEIYPREMKTQTHAKMWIHVRAFIAALLTTAKKWKQPTCPLTNEWIYPTMESYPAIKMTKLLTEATICTNLNNIVLDERSQIQKITHIYRYIYDTSFMKF